MMDNTVKKIRYEFLIERGEGFYYDIEIDAMSLEHPVPLEPAPEWARLCHNKCPHCPLNSETSEYCPLALRIAPILNISNSPAFEPVQIRVHKEGTVFESTGTLQEGFRSLIGLIMATSGCPHAAFFKPMAWFHLPFAGKDETLFRACATFLLFQFFDPGDDPNSQSYTDLKQVYENIHIVNQHISDRLRSVAAHEHTVNALTVLDIFAQSFMPTLNDSLQELAFLFKPRINEVGFDNL